jgi:hypothetical protein
VGNRITCAPVHFHINNQFFYLVVTGGIIEADEAATQDSHADPYYLSWTQMTVGCGRGCQQSFKRLHEVFLLIK